MNTKDKILQKLAQINQYVEELEDFLPSDVEEYMGDLTTRRACEKTIELAIETVIDIASILISEQKIGVPKDEEDIFLLLQKKKILSKDLTQRVKLMKGFRNILVHQYGDVDDEKAYFYMKNELEDFTLFEKEIIIFLKQK